MLSDYMAECLTHPTHGYYTNRDPLGSAGDFTTAPEISQMFGELLGLALAKSWLDQGAPSPITLAEPGPGRGTLMADILRATRSVPGFHAAARVTLIEVSPTLRTRQAEALRGHAPTWLNTLDALPTDTPLFLIANEYFDALPIRQFRRSGTGWSERMVGLTGGALSFGWSPPAPIASLPDAAQDGDIVERNAPAEAQTAAIAQRISANGGAALIIDYGDWRSLGDTFQAVRNHDPVDPLSDPGTADLTAHAAFEPLATAATGAGASVTQMTTQGILLERLGITPRAQALAKNLTGDALNSHIAAHRRLTHPDEMGHLFKAIAIHPMNTPPPPGFDP